MFVITENIMKRTVFIHPYSEMRFEISKRILAVGVSNNNCANKWAQRQRTTTIQHAQLHQFSGLQCKHADKLKVGKT
jgi:phosphoribosylanthranilate isomerase